MLELIKPVLFCGLDFSNIFEIVLAIMIYFIIDIIQKKLIRISKSIIDRK